MKIIVITSNRRDEKEPEIVNSFFANGLETLHLRKPRLSTRELSEYIEKIPAHFHKKIVIHSHHKLAGKYNLKGIHFTKSHLHHPRKTWFRMKMLGLKRNINTLTLSSSHSKLSTLYDVGEFNYDYVFLSPIFDSLTGKFQSGFYEEGIKAAIAKTGKKIIARGGVDFSKVEKINELGFEGMALYSALWEKADPLEEYIKVLKRCDELGIKTE
jgi:thiamine-phosphate pyrophosphorylase